MRPLWEDLPAQRTPGTSRADPSVPIRNPVATLILVFGSADHFADTKEKPFRCSCGAGFARRDLLSRHQRINCHEDTPGGSSPVNEDACQVPFDLQEAAEPGFAAAVSLSTLSGLNAQQPFEHWPQGPPGQQYQLTPDEESNYTNGQARGYIAEPYNQSLVAPELLDDGEPFTTTRVPYLVPNPANVTRPLTTRALDIRT